VRALADPTRPGLSSTNEFGEGPIDRLGRWTRRRARLGESSPCESIGEDDRVFDSQAACPFSLFILSVLIPRPTVEN
jgi:hypothetical protein